MTIWPDTLPQSPLADGYGETAPDNTVRTEMEQGPAKIRRRGTAAVRKLRFALLLDAAQVETLDDFYAETLAGGALAFTFPQPRGDGTVQCRFVKPPEYGAAGKAFRAAMELEVLP